MEIEKSNLIKAYRANITLLLTMPLIGAAVAFMGITPFMISGGFGISSGMWIFSIGSLFVGILIILYPFTFKIHLMTNHIIHKSILSSIKTPLSNVVQVGHITERILNGAPIAIAKVILIRADGQFFDLKLGRISLNSGKEIINYISSNLPFKGDSDGHEPQKYDLVI